MFGDCLTEPAWHNMDERFSEPTSINVLLLMVMSPIIPSLECHIFGLFL
jgi:hypothetical protein